MTGHPWRVLMVSRHPVDPTVHSGTAYFMREALRLAGCAVTTLDRLLPPPRARAMLERGPDFCRRAARTRARQLLARLGGRVAPWGRNAVMAEYYARRIQAELARAPYDIVLADKAEAELAALDTRVPIVYSHDATVEVLRDYDDSFARLTRRAARELAELERRATERAAALVYRSEWVAASARRTLAVPADRIRVLYPGPNLLPAWMPGQVRPRPPAPSWRLLLIGRDWERKGVARAIAAAERLIAEGRSIQLLLCGTRVPRGVRLPSFVNAYPDADKNKPDERARLLGLYAGATCFLMPTLRECLGMSLLEAMAFGLPCVATTAGGVPEAVEHGVSGSLVSPGGSAEELAQAIADICGNPEKHHACSLAARARYETLFTWQRWSRDMLLLFADITRAHRPP